MSGKTQTTREKRNVTFDKNKLNLQVRTVKENKGKCFFNCSSFIVNLHKY